MKSVQIRSYLWSAFPVFSRNTGKYGPEKTPYLDTFHAVNGTGFTLQTRYLVRKFIFVIISTCCAHPVVRARIQNLQLGKSFWFKWPKTGFATPNPKVNVFF